MTSKWPTKRLGEVALIAKGVSYTSAGLEDSGRAMVNLKNIGKGGGFRPEGTKYYSGEVKPTHVLRGGDLLIAYTDLTKAKEILGCPVIIPDSAEYVGGCFSMDLGRIDPDTSILSHEFLAYWLQSKEAREYMRANGSGATVMHLRTAAVPEMEVPLPPLDEQKRIVAKLDEAMSERERLSSVSLRTSQMVDELSVRIICEQRNTDISSFGTTALGSVIDLQAGVALKSEGFTQNSDDLKILGGESIGFRSVNWSSGKRWPKDDVASFSGFLLAPNDIVLAMDRPWVKSGLKIARLTQSDLPSLLIQRTARLRCTKQLMPEYLELMLISPDFTDYLLRSQTGSGVPHISGKQIANYEIPVPPLKQQELTIKRTSNVLDQGRRLARVLGEKETALSNLESSLLAYAFAGGL